MIFDRTFEDCQKARLIIRDKVQKGILLTEQDLETLAKGTLNLDTIARIETAQAELKAQIERLGYLSLQGFESKEWGREDVFYKSDLDRIIVNNRILRNAFFVYANSPPQPVSEYYFETFNKIEKLLADLQKMVSYVVSHIQECGTIESGEV